MGIDVEALGGLLAVLNEVINDLRFDLEFMFQDRAEETCRDISSLMAVKCYKFLAHLENNRE